jgi:hypothetical protein
MESSFIVESPIPNSGEVITVGTGISTLNPAKYTLKGSRTKNASAAFITIETADIRFTMDGTNPVSLGNGHRVVQTTNQGFTLRGMDAIRNFKATREGSQDAKMVVTYFYA